MKELFENLVRDNPWIINLFYSVLTLIVARVSPRSKAKFGDAVKVAFDINRMHFFDPETEVCICH